MRKDLSARAPPPPEQAQAIWDSSCDDQRDGILSEWLSADEPDVIFGTERWLATIRFAVWQKLKYRMADDASKGHNQTYGCSETIHTTSASVAATSRVVFASIWAVCAMLLPFRVAAAT